MTPRFLFQSPEEWRGLFRKLGSCAGINCLSGVVFVLGFSPIWADVKMPAIFGDHMVLQQDTALPVWGTADAGEKVTVSVGSSTGSAVAGTDGKWMVKLTPLPAGTTPLTMTVAGKNTLTFQDVLAGDVWICSGQSNMEFGLSMAHNAQDEIPKANIPLLRLFLVPLKASLVPLNDIAALPPDTSPLTGHWQVCTPENVINIGGWKGFSAIGYFFGRELQSHLNRPIGLIGSYWGGTPAKAWTSVEALQKEPILKRYADFHDRMLAGDTPEAEADYQSKETAYLPLKAKWDQDFGVAYNATMKDWNEATAKAKAAGQPLPPKPLPSTPAPAAPNNPAGGPNFPCTLFNGMIAPLIPYAIKGTIWYQGEADIAGPVLYRTLFADMITDWRAQWGQGDFPFLFVQLAGCTSPNLNWAELQYSQLKTLSLPNTGMATAVDVGGNSIHPRDKIDVGLRLALAARHVAYGENLVYSGPIYDKIEIADNKATVHFTQIGSGLVIGKTPWVADGLVPLPTDSLVGFTIAGADNKFVPADATITGNSVVVSSSQVTQPVSVRYAFGSATGNLYNKEGLPASPFRSDLGAEAPAPAQVPAIPPPVTTPPSPAGK
jgi:sialate O-acetylesterase